MKALWAVAGVVVLAALASWAGAVPVVAAPEPRALPAPGALEPIERPALLAAAARLRERNPFRVGRRPANARYNPWEPVVSPSVTSAPNRPRLSLTGVLGGPPWNAVIEGIPGHETGVVLGVDEVVDGFRLVSIRGDTVRIAGQDTTWTLTPRSAWP